MTDEHQSDPNADESDDAIAWIDAHLETGDPATQATAGDLLTDDDDDDDSVDDHDGVDSDQDAAGDGAAEGAAAVAGASLSERIVARTLRRPVAWWTQPWTNDRILRLVVTVAALTTSTLIMMKIVHLSPLGGDGDLIFDNTTPTGGDMGAHVWAPAFLRDHLLPNGQISGWSMDWYGGLPLYRFYMVIPALAIVALDVILPYGIAFKVVAMSGLLFFPLACWAFGRLAAFRHPLPELFAFGGLCFLLDESFEIYGGNVKSTMAGEYSFSIALTLAVFGFGLLAHGLRTGRYRVWAAVVLSLASVSHGIVLIFVAFGAVVICLVWIDWKRLWFAVTTGLTTVLLSAWWVGPFLLGHEFMTDMKYGFRPNSSTDSFWDMYFPLTPALDILIMTLAVIGFAGFIVRRQLTGTALGLISILFALGVWHTRESLPVIGLLWNPRLLPFVYLTRYLLMVAGAYEVISWGVNLVRRRLADRDLNAGEATGAFAAIGVSILIVFGFMYEVLPGGGRVVATEGEAAVYAWGPIRKTAEGGRAVADGWSRYNWLGYEGRTAYPAYHHLVTTMDDLGQNNGCGRALWENNSANSEYGTTMSLMLLPHWTDGCIGSMEGLFFEATASTNYHFITAAAVSESSSNPVRQLRYTNNDAEIGVRHMRDLGVRYLMVRTDAAKAEAATAEGLSFVGLSGTWEIYEVTESSIVEPLEVAPVVVDHADGDWYKPGDDRERNLELGTSWFQNPTDWPAIPVDEGPTEWQRVTATLADDLRIDPFDDQRRKVDYVRPSEPFVPQELPDIAVSNVEIRQQSIGFSVDQIGVPVLVKVSYFPNWQVEGAEGPYRAGANHMIVVPTSTDVELTYDSRSGLDWFFYLLTALGIGLCVLWRRMGDVTYASDVPSFGSSDGDDGGLGDGVGRGGDRDEVALVPPPVGTAVDDPTAPITFTSQPDDDDDLASILGAADDPVSDAFSEAAADGQDESDSSADSSS